MKRLQSLIASFFIWIISFMPAGKVRISRTQTVTEKKNVKPKDPAKVKMVPIAEHEWNPLLKYPRNESCWCGSQIKAKKCCLLRQPRAINKEFAEQARPHVKTIREKNG